MGKANSELKKKRLMAGASAFCLLIPFFLSCVLLGQVHISYIKPINECSSMDLKQAFKQLENASNVVKQQVFSFKTSLK